MASEPPGSPATTPAPTDRLDSWKQIAAYLGKSERTVRRWSQAEGLPVHRHVHQQRGSVWAYRAELDVWLQGRRPTPERPRRWKVLGAAAALVLLAVALIPWLSRRPLSDRLTDPDPLTTLPGPEFGPAFSPDSRQIAFFWGNPGGKPGIYLRTLGTDTQTPLVVSKTQFGTVGGTFNYNPAWSPDGKTIAFLRRIPGETWLYLIASSGGPNERWLGSRPAAQRSTPTTCT